MVGLGLESSCRGKISSGRDCHTDQAVFLHLPKNSKVVSQPVNAWNAGSAIALDGPSSLTMSCTGMYL